MYELQVQGDRIPGAFFRMKGGVREGRIKEGEVGKFCRTVTGVFRGGHPNTELIVVGGSWLMASDWWVVSGQSAGLRVQNSEVKVQSRGLRVHS